MIDIGFIRKNFPKGQLTIVGARPAMGKSSFAISLALSLAKVEINSIYFSLEMSEKQFVRRAIKQISESLYKKIEGEIYIDDTPCIMLSEMQKVLDSLSVDYVFIDYIHLIKDEGGRSRKEELSHIVNTLKQFALDYDVAVIALSQIKREWIRGQECPSNYGCRPDLNSFSFDNDCLDNVNLALLHRPEYYRHYEYYANGKRVVGKLEYIQYNDNHPTITLMHLSNDTTEVSLWMNWSRVKEEILNSPNWIISLDENDLKSFEEFDNNEICVSEMSTTDQTECRFEQMCNQLSNLLSDKKDKFGKMLMFIQFPINSPIMMSEMTYIQEMLEKSSHDDVECEIKWGLSPREDDVSRIVCALK